MLSRQLGGKWEEQRKEGLGDLGATGGVILQESVSIAMYRMT